MIQERFDKVFVINLTKDKERKELTIKRLKKIGMEEGRDYDFFRATSGSSNLINFKGEKKEGWNTNALALAYTTKRILKLAKKNKWKSVFIMEDDVDFIINFSQLFKTQFKGVPDNWDFIHLNANHRISPKWFCGITHKIKAAICCQAYGVNHTMYDEYIKELESTNIPIDEITLKLHGKDNSYCTVPNLVIHHENKYSTLREKIVNY